MTLNEYAKEGNASLADLATHLGRSLSGVRKWAYFQRAPSLGDALKIEAFTAGAVTVADLIPADPDKGRAA